MGVSGGGGLGADVQDMDDVVTVLASVLQRAAQRLKNLRDRAENCQPGDVGKLSAELGDAMMDVCQLTILLCKLDRLLCKMDRGEAAGNLQEYALANVRKIAIQVVHVLDHDLSSIKDAHQREEREEIILAKVEDQIQRTVANSDAIETLQRKLGDIQREFCESARPPLNLVAIVLRVGIATVAAAGVGAPVTAVVFNDPISKKILEAALGTFIGSVVVELGAVATERYRQARIDQKLSGEVVHGNSDSFSPKAETEDRLKIRHAPGVKRSCEEGPHRDVGVNRG